MSKIVWNINQYNWEQDTPYLWPQWCFNSSLWVDIRKEPPFIKLSPALQLEHTFDSKVCFQKNLEDFWLSWMLYCLENGKIYLNWTLKQTINSWTNAWNKIIGVWYMQNSWWTSYLYYFSNLEYNEGKMYRSPDDLSWIWNTAFRNFEVWWVGLVNDLIPVISESDRLIIWVRDRIFEFDELEPATLTTKLTLQKGEEVIYISEYQNYYRIYVSIWTETTWSFSNGRIYEWDWQSKEEWDYIENWKNLPFQWVVNEGAYDKVITGQNNSYTDLYRNPWKQIIRVNLEWLSSTSDKWKRNFSKYITTRNEINYISWQNKEWIYCIFTLWQYFPWFSESLVWEYYIDNTSDYFLFHTHTHEKSYFSRTDNKIYSALNTNLNIVYNATWYIYTKKWIWNGIHTKKSVDYMYVWYKLSTGTSISIYADSGSWEKLLKTIAITTETPITQKGIRIEANEFQSVDLWDFYELQLKIVLNTTNTANTPAIWPILLFCNDEYNK